MAGFHKAAGFEVFHSPFTKGWMFTAVVNGISRFALCAKFPERRLRGCGCPANRHTRRNEFVG
jgi:hypothetical protein